MKQYNEYEDLIVARLANKDWEVSPLSLISNLNQPQTKPRIYVICSGSTFEDTRHLGDFAQEESLNFKAIITARTREGEKGVFAVAEEIMQRLMKWKLPDTTERISLSSFGYVDGIQNNWQYHVDFTFPRIRIMREEPQEEVLITKITQKVKVV